MAQTLSGAVFDDVNRNGVRDAGEPALAGIGLDLLGNGGAVDLTASTNSAGLYSFAPPGSAQYLLGINQPGGLRPSLLDMAADAAPIPSFPVGRLRPGSLAGLTDSLRLASGAAPLLHYALGDSIGFGFNLCGSALGQNGYLEPYTARLNSIAPTVLNKQPVLGNETPDLLTPGSDSIFAAINAGADLVTISIGGNDFLANDGNEAATAANLVATRQNLQEILSTLVDQTDAAILVNTVYDNKPGTNAFHNRWVPIWNQVLRDVVWSQRRSVGLAEIYPDYAHLDSASGEVRGEPDLVCQDFLGLDRIHPTTAGYQLHREKVWQGSGGVAMGAAGTVNVDLGFNQQIEQRFPGQFTDVAGGVVAPASALALDGSGALVPAGNQELRLSGFDATPRGLLEQAIVHVRYRTTAAPANDVYYFEASVDGSFSAPGMTDQTWNTIVPIVGGAGNSGAAILAFPDQPSYRTVSTVVTQGSPVDGSPSLTWQDLATIAVRLDTDAVSGADSFDVEWDAAWLELYGVPEERQLVRGDGTVGSQLRIDTTGEQGALVLQYIATSTGQLSSGTWGDFLLDPATAILLYSGTVGSTGALTIQPTIPAIPGIQGLTVYFQSLVVKDIPNKIGSFTNLASITFP